MKITVTVIRYLLLLALICASILALASDALILKPAPPSGDIPAGPSSGDHIGGPDEGDPENPSEPILPDDTVPNWSVEPIVYKYSTKDQSGKITCEVRYSYPSVSSNDGSDVSEFARELDMIASRIRLFVDTKIALYKNGTSDDFSVPPQITGYYKINKFSTELFSITFVFSEIAPDSTVSETYMNYNLDLLLSSKKISIDSVMNDAVGTLRKILVQKKESGKLSLLANYENMLSGSIDGSWSVNANGIVFRFAKGTLSPASYGDIEISITNAELIPLLSEYGKILLNLPESVV